VVFLIPPTHIELQRALEPFGLKEEFDTYRRELSKLAPVLDFDFANALTNDRSAFSDPYHLTEETARRVVRAIALREGDLLRVWSNSDLERSLNGTTSPLSPSE
jgi:hypothetical protein